MNVQESTAAANCGIDMSQFFRVFFEEAAEHLATMENLLLAIDPEAAGDEELNAIFRAAHSIKGGSGTFGFTDMTEVTHELESLLDKARKHEIVLTVAMVDALLAAGDVLKLQLARHRGESDVAEPAVAEVCARIREFVSGAVKPASVDVAPVAPVAPAADADYGFFDDPAPTPVAAESDEGYGFFTDPAPAQDEVLAPVAAVPNKGRRKSDLRDEIAGVRSGRRDNDKVVVSAQGDQASIRVGVDKVDQLINQVGELVITQAMLAQSVAKLDPVLHQVLVSGMSDLERNTRSLQESVMSIRMLPIAFVFNRFPRMARDLAAKLGKQVSLVLEGEGTELDKGLIEKISDPLTHLVRNSIDHGIESVEKRTAAGKPEMGTVTLRASHQGGSIVIEVCDDGAGLNRERILAKASERGLPVADDASDEDVWRLIFEAGFSTADEVTDVSGRGVGMDVVKRNIGELGGTVDIDSAPGRGTRMIVRLPLTLAIIDGMSIAVGSDVYIIPIASVVESLQATASEVKPIAGGGRVIEVRKEYLPVIPLAEVFATDAQDGASERGIMLVVESDGAKNALLVDGLLGQQQVVVKSLETNYRKVPGVSGATIMGDGRVALILDVPALVKMRSH